MSVPLDECFIPSSQEEALASELDELKKQPTQAQNEQDQASASSTGPVTRSNGKTHASETNMRAASPVTHSKQSQSNPLKIHAKSSSNMSEDSSGSDRDDDIQLSSVAAVMHVDVGDMSQDDEVGLSDEGSAAHSQSSKRGIRGGFGRAAEQVAEPAASQDLANTQTQTQTQTQQQPKQQTQAGTGNGSGQLQGAQSSDSADRHIAHPLTQAEGSKSPPTSPTSSCSLRADDVVAAVEASSQGELEEETVVPALQQKQAVEEHSKDQVSGRPGARHHLSPTWSRARVARKMSSIASSSVHDNRPSNTMTQPSDASAQPPSDDARATAAAESEGRLGSDPALSLPAPASSLTPLDKPPGTDSTTASAASPQRHRILLRRLQRTRIPPPPSVFAESSDESQADQSEVSQSPRVEQGLSQPARDANVVPNSQQQPSQSSQQSSMKGPSVVGARAAASLPPSGEKADQAQSPKRSRPNQHSASASSKPSPVAGTQVLFDAPPPSAQQKQHAVDSSQASPASASIQPQSHEAEQGETSSFQAHQPDYSLVTSSSSEDENAEATDHSETNAMSAHSRAKAGSKPGNSQAGGPQSPRIQHARDAEDTSATSQNLSSKPARDDQPDLMLSPSKSKPLASQQSIHAAPANSTSPQQTIDDNGLASPMSQKAGLQAAVSAISKRPTTGTSPDGSAWDVLSDVTASRVSPLRSKVRRQVRLLTEANQAASASPSDGSAANTPSTSRPTKTMPLSARPRQIVDVAARKTAKVRPVRRKVTRSTQQDTDSSESDGELEDLSPTRAANASQQVLGSSARTKQVVVAEEHLVGVVRFQQRPSTKQTARKTVQKPAGLTTGPTLSPRQIASPFSQGREGEQDEPCKGALPVVDQQQNMTPENEREKQVSNAQLEQQEERHHQQETTQHGQNGEAAQQQQQEPRQERHNRSASPAGGTSQPSLHRGASSQPSGKDSKPAVSSPLAKRPRTQTNVAPQAGLASLAATATHVQAIALQEQSICEAETSPDKGKRRTSPEKSSGSKRKAEIHATAVSSRAKRVKSVAPARPPARGNAQGRRSSLPATAKQPAPSAVMPQQRPHSADHLPPYVRYRMAKRRSEALASPLGLKSSSPTLPVRSFTTDDPHEASIRRQRELAAAYHPTAQELLSKALAYWERR